jgi:hypothetical protein
MGGFEEYKNIYAYNSTMLTPESILKSAFGYDIFNVGNDTIAL